MIPFKAMILAAGLGTRLRPLTFSRPKVLMPVQNRPLLHWLIDYLRGAGAEAVILNAHHLSEVLAAHLASRDLGIPVQVRVEGALLGTGGGIRNVADFWDRRPFVVMNGDILSAIDLQRVIRGHLQNQAVATLVLTDEPQFNQVQVGADGRILRFKDGPPEASLAFTGIQVVSPEVLDVIPTQGTSSIIQAYERLIAVGRRVMAHVVRGEYWRELGEVTRYLAVHQEFSRLEKSPIPGLRTGPGAIVHPSARVGKSVRLAGTVCLGADCEVSDGATVEGSILWDRVKVGPGCSVRRSIIGDGVELRESVRDAVVVREGIEHGA
ncbi:MAG TPA: NDP-sugar synthase [Syntrophobacteria bacterium]|nr:NDP-sugar synthase [Syntrophobacteria bacterium]